MAGKADMTLHGLRQLAEWSLQHACMEPDLLREVRGAWEEAWEAFCRRIVEGEFTLALRDGEEEAEAETAGAGADADHGRPAAGGLPVV